MRKAATVKGAGAATRRIAVKLSWRVLAGNRCRDADDLEIVKRLWNTTQHYRPAYTQLIGPGGAGNSP